MISDTFNRKNLKLISFILIIKERDPFVDTNVHKKSNRLLQNLTIFYQLNNNQLKISIIIF